jgi:hypothetical protein
VLEKSLTGGKGISSLKNVFENPELARAIKCPDMIELLTRAPSKIYQSK